MIKINVKDKADIERVFLIIQIGILECLKSGAIRMEEAELFMINPYIVNNLKKYGINESIIKIFEEGCELEDIESLLPDRLSSNIQLLINKCNDFLKQQTNIYELSKERIVTFDS